MQPPHGSSDTAVPAYIPGCATDAVDDIEPLPTDQAFRNLRRTGNWESGLPYAQSLLTGVSRANPIVLAQQISAVQMLCSLLKQTSTQIETISARFGDDHDAGMKRSLAL